MDFSKLDFSTSSYHISTNTGPIDMFFTKKYNYFSRETRWNHPFLYQSQRKGCNCSLKLTSDFICRRLYYEFSVHQKKSIWFFTVILDDLEGVGTINPHPNSSYIHPEVDPSQIANCVYSDIILNFSSVLSFTSSNLSKRVVCFQTKVEIECSTTQLG